MNDFYIIGLVLFGFSILKFLFDRAVIFMLDALMKSELENND